VAANATRDAQRAQRLFDAGALAQRGLDEAKAAATAATNELTAARENVRQIEAERAAAQAAVGASAVRSDAAVAVVATRRGRVLRLFVESPRVVPAGTPLAQLGDVSELEAVIPILSADAPRVRAGATVRFALGSSVDTITGVVTLVEPAAYTKYSALGVEEQRVNVIASVQDSAGRLGDQYRLDARIAVWENEVLKVPTSSLVRDGDAWSVFVVRSGRAEQVGVTVGERTAEAAEVRDGLAEGDRVILYPAEEIGTGSRVRERADR
jgi:HlyD family secretion protein